MYWCADSYFTSCNFASTFRGNRHQVEKERRMRREIANSNERRRMQSINMGYQKLKNMLPVKDGGEKLSKVCSCISLFRVTLTRSFSWSQIVECESFSHQQMLFVWVLNRRSFHSPTQQLSLITTILMVVSLCGSKYFVCDQFELVLDDAIVIWPVFQPRNKQV